MALNKVAAFIARDCAKLNRENEWDFRRSWARFYDPAYSFFLVNLSEYENKNLFR